MSYSNYRINPIIQVNSTDTLQRCSHCLTYIAESVNGLSDAEMTVTAHKGLQSIIECIQLALDYEFYRLRDQNPPKVNH